MGVLTLRHGHAPRQRPRERCRAPRNEVVQVMLEIGVVGLDHRAAEAAGQPQARVVRDERRLDMHHIDIIGAQRLRPTHQWTPLEEAVFGIAGHAA